MSKIYIVGILIGNLKDIIYRVVKILRLVDWIVCEDIRVIVKFLVVYDIKKLLVIYNKNNEKNFVKLIIDRLI